MDKLEPLFIGTGGGNDIFSTVLAMMSLSQIGFDFDSASIAGVLSPFLRHDGICPVHKENGDICDGLYLINPNSQAFVETAKYKRPIDFVDAKVAHLSANFPIKSIENIYGLSISNGSDGLAETFRYLAKKYSPIVLVDVGGDIFYSGERDDHVLSPMFDSIVLRAFVDSGVYGSLFLTGIGTDGEINPDHIYEILRTNEFKKYPLNPDNMDTWNDLFYKYISNSRKGNTVPNTINGFYSPNKFMNVRVKARHFIDNRVFHREILQDIYTVGCKNFFIGDPKLIINPFSVSCTSPLDWFYKTQFKTRTNSEMNLGNLFSGTHHYLVLTPSPLLYEKDVRQILDIGVSEVVSGVYDGAFVFENDIPKIEKSCLSGIKHKYRLGRDGNDGRLILLKSK